MAPAQYTAIYNALVGEGKSEKAAKSEAAATWNKHHPDDPLSNYVNKETGHTTPAKKPRKKRNE